VKALSAPFILQDTVVGLQALAGFAGMVSGGTQTITAAVEMSEDDSPFSIFELNPDNSIVQFTAKMPRVDTMMVKTSGTGCYLFQVSVNYTVVSGRMIKHNVNTFLSLQLTCLYHRGPRQFSRSTTAAFAPHQDKLLHRVTLFSTARLQVS